MKKKLVVLGMLFGLTFCMQPVFAAEAADVSALGVGVEQDAVYSVTVTFDANGGSGVMNSLTSASNVSTSLTSNVFTRSGFTFTGWNTAADGTGTAYADAADVTQLAAAEYNGQTITLYAQWKLNAPSIKSVKSSTPASMKVTYKKNSKAAGYEISYATKKSFKGAKKVTAKKGSSNTEITNVIPGKTYYVRMRSYYKAGGVKKYSDWSKSKKIKMKKGATLANTKALTAIEADITLTGSGSGYHAKLVLCTPTSAVSYGIQYDKCASAPYTGKAMAMIENVASNAAGGQSYSRPGNRELQPGKTYHMMMTVDKKGNGNVYLDYKKIGSFSNAGLANQAVYIRVEGAVRLNGDQVKATFDNIKLRQGGKLEADKKYGGWFPSSNKGIKTKKVNNKNKVIISGTGSGINGDWDSDYENVSGIFQFY
ncbi:InlB B-repeat-containing protein [Roseburia sp. BX1005]|uniref:InlB B-repeat-containing protein n=1 Tax=Roseburia zhanii TaxID=2763064 RepID=A0A923LR30_9FIRM|nr:InlB B-repeat-containing protein [Roseburia zhanii]MBC5715517.1 InlB B-repeat-containing protein [Roseburia zhanii]